MNLKKSILYTAAALTILLQSCGGYKTSDSGLQYQIFVDSAGTNVEMGGLAFVDMRYVNEKDTFTSAKMNMGQPIPIRLPDSSTFKASLEEGLSMLSKGDSASFIISTDSLYKNIFHEPLPKEIKPGGNTTFFLRVINVLSKDSVKSIENKRKEQMMAAQIQRQIQMQTDTVSILDYCKKNKIKPKRTPDGVYYTIKKSTEGITLQPGDTAKTIYTGKLLDGSVFDSNVGKEPFPVVVGMGQVIRGWDSGLMALKKGEKATLLIPSMLGYGERGAGAAIPANAVLVFDVEILK